MVNSVVIQMNASHKLPPVRLVLSPRQSCNTALTPMFIILLYYENDSAYRRSTYWLCLFAHNLPALWERATKCLIYMTPTTLNILRHAPTLCLFSTAKRNTLRNKIGQKWNMTIWHAALLHGCETQQEKQNSFAPHTYADKTQRPTVR